MSCWQDCQQQKATFWVTMHLWRISRKQRACPRTSNRKSWKPKWRNPELTKLEKPIERLPRELPCFTSSSMTSTKYIPCTSSLSRWLTFYFSVALFEKLRKVWHKSVWSVRFEFVNCFSFNCCSFQLLRTNVISGFQHRIWEGNRQSWSGWRHSAKSVESYWLHHPLSFCLHLKRPLWKRQADLHGPDNFPSIYTIST